MLRLVGILGVAVVVGITALLALSIVLINVDSGAAPTKNEPGAYTKAFVQDAIDRYEADGREVTIDYHSSQESVDGEWYVFIIDAEGYTIAHPRAEFIGGDLSLRVDVTGYFYGDDLRSATEEGKWISYVFLNPATGSQDAKHTWVVKHDGLVFGSGWYERSYDTAPTKNEPGAYTKAFVQDAIRRYEADGREATIDYHNSQESVDGEWYAIIIDAEGYTIAHPRAEFIGGDLSLRVDVTGYFYGDDVRSATEEGKWISYVFLNPATGSQDAKHTWVVKHDRLLFGSGWYERSYDTAPTKNEPGAYTKAFVQDAIRRYEADGREATIDYYNSQESVDGEWYLVVIGEDGRMISHPTIPENIGQDLMGPAGTDVAGNVFGPDLLNATEAGKWVSYVYLNPATGEQGEKRSWAVKHDGLVFVSGWYKG